jgi:hypothetical protein
MVRLARRYPKITLTTFVASAIVVLVLAAANKDWGSAAVVVSTYVLVVVTAAYVVLTYDLVQVTSEAPQRQAVAQLRTCVAEAQVLLSRVLEVRQTELTGARPTRDLLKTYSTHTTQLQQAEWRLGVLSANVVPAVAGPATEVANLISRATRRVLALNTSMELALEQKPSQATWADVEQIYRDKIQAEISDKPQFEELRSGQSLEQAKERCAQFLAGKG